MISSFKLVWALAVTIGLITMGEGHLWQSLLGLTPAAGIALSILGLAAIAWIWEIIPLFVTSLLVLILNVVWLLPELNNSGLELTSSAFTAPFFSDVILLFLGGFVLSSSFARYGLDERLAHVVLARTGRNPAIAIASLMGTTAFLSMWMSNTATTAMMLSLAGPVLARAKQFRHFQRAVILGIPFAANLGGLGTPIGTPPNAIALQYLRDVQGHEFSFPTWMLMVFPSMIALLILVWLVLLRIHRGHTPPLTFEPIKVQPLSMEQWMIIGIALVTIVGWLTGPLHGIPTGMVALLPVVLNYGTKLLDPQSFRKLPWDVLILAGGGMSLGVAVSTSGLASNIVSLVPAQAPFMAIAAAFAIIASALSTFISNTATANLLIPVAMGLPESIRPPIICVIALACSVSMALPITTPPNAMAFGSGHIRVVDMMIPGTIITGAGVLAAILSLFWWQALGIF
ncbi:MAG: DASS family sodium-coupled anion symporter [Myxococcales bacterium]|nr:DASS family sodium-coupled anion symporter [Myxococcales bacterium]